MSTPPLWPDVVDVMYAHHVVERLGRIAKLRGDSADAHIWYEAARRMERHLLERIPEIEQLAQEGRLPGVKPEQVS